MKASKTRFGMSGHQFRDIRSSDDRLLPALLDRLTDDAPQRKKERFENNLMSADQLKQAVLRDLAWLLNTISFETDNNLEDFSHVRQSTVNFGVAAMAGRKMSEIDPSEIEQTVLEAIKAYEPRLLHEGLSVQCIRENSHLEHYNILCLVIRGMLWCNPYPVEFYVKTEVDLESGHIEVAEGGAEYGQ